MVWEGWVRGRPGRGAEDCNGCCPVGLGVPEGAGWGTSAMGRSREVDGLSLAGAGGAATGAIAGNRGRSHALQ